MKNFIITIFLIVFSSSCTSVKNLEENKYIYKSKNRELVLIFNNDNTCSIINIFLCNDIDEDIKEIVINATYKKTGNMIVIKNVNCITNDCSYSPIMEIPIQKSINCSFLNNEEREGERIFDGKTYNSNYDNYGLIPNIDVDTMYAIKKEIIFTKKTKEGSFGFVFKKK